MRRETLTHSIDQSFIVSAAAALVLPEEERARGGRTGCDVTLSDDDVTRLESCLDDVGRPFVAGYLKSLRRRRKETHDVCG